jgi:CYTH domain-containing protein
MADAGPFGKYARPERERRFLLRAAPDGLGPGVRIEDRYIDRSRLRLRRVEGAGGTLVMKLGQKLRVDDADPSTVWLTNLYLSASEYEVLAALPGAELRKVRHRWELRGGPFSVDVFEGPLAGIVLAEVECADDDLFADVATPPGALADVSRDDRFSGGSLARLSESAAAGLLSEWAVR